MGNGSVLRGLLGRLTGSRAVASPSRTSAQWRSRGNAALAQANLEEAARCYAQAVHADPNDPLAHLNLGFALLETGDAAAAATSLERSIALGRAEDDFLHEARFLLGRASIALGDQDRALANFDIATRLRPDFAEPLVEGARLLHEAQRDDEALAWAERLAALRPTRQTRLLLAQLMARCNRFAEALTIADELLAAEPGNVEAMRVRGQALHKAGRGQEALDAFARVEALAGPDCEDLVIAAAALQELGRLAEATDAYERALRLQPGHHVALSRRAAVLVRQLRLPEAIEAAHVGLQFFADDADLHWNLAIAHLLLGEFERGFDEAQWRWKISAGVPPRPVPDTGPPLWTGQDLRGRTILLAAEQGLGDSIQFVRYVPQIAQRADKVWLLVPDSLGALVEGLAPNCARLSPGAALPEADYHCPLLDLPRATGTTLGSIPSAVPYLHAPEDRADAWRNKLLPLAASTKVGLVWSGNPAHSNDRNRSIALAQFRSVAAPGCAFVSLQPEVRAGDAEALRQWPHLMQAGPQLRDFADTAAVLESLDLVITVDTSVAHLAGALARPVWILLPYCPDWRWMVERGDSPWYPTARLYRQSAPGDWQPVLDRVRQDLMSLTTRASA